jgi:hypothetical protein
MEQLRLPISKVRLACNFSITITMPFLFIIGKKLLLTNRFLFFYFFRDDKISKDLLKLKFLGLKWKGKERFPLIMQFYLKPPLFGYEIVQI